MKWIRRLLVALLVIGIVAGGLLVAAHFYLQSEAVTRQVAEQLRKTLNSPVEIEQAEVSLFGDSTLRGVRLYESEADKDPWLTADAITADVSVLDALRGAIALGRVEARGASVRLRFNKEGELLTRLPKVEETEPERPLPAVHIADGHLRIDQEGYPPFILDNLNARLEEGPGGMRLAGTINDPDWGDWQIEGVLPENEQADAVLTLRTDKARVTRERLEALPFVAPAVWEQVTANGDTRAEVRFLLRGHKKEFGYFIELHPLGANIGVPIIALNASDVRGAIIIDDSLVRLEAVRGRAAEGEIIVESATLDFRQEPDVLTFDVRVAGADWQKLAADWDVPQGLRNFSGQLTGEANVTVTIGEQVTTTGTGKGKILNARLGKVLLDKPVELTLKGQGGKLRFGSDKLSGAIPAPARGFALWLPALVFAQPEPREGPSLTDLPAAAARLVQQGAAEVSQAIAEGGKTVLRYVPDASRAREPGREPTYLETSLSFKDIDIGQLIKETEVQLPFPVEGRGSIQVKVALPVDTPGELSAYRATGTADLTRLKLAGLELEQVKAALQLEKGVLRLTELTGRFPGEQAGGLNGTARLQLDPLGELTAKLGLNAVPLARVATLAPEVKGQVEGFLSGDLTFSAPAEKVEDPSTWKVSGTFRGDRLRAFGWALNEASLALETKDGQLLIKPIRGELKGLNIVGESIVTLKTPYTYQARLNTDRARLEAFKQLLPDVRLPVDVRGTLSLTADLKGTLSPFALDASGRVTAENLTVGEVPVGAASFNWKVSPESVQLSKLEADLFGGEVSGEAVIPIEPDRAGRANVRFKDLDLGALTRSVEGFPVPLEGKADGTITGNFPPVKAGEERAYTIKTELKAPKLRVRRIPAEKLTGTITYSKGVLEYHLEGATLGGTFDVDGKVPLGGQGEKKVTPPARPPADGRVRLRQAQPGEQFGGRFRLRQAQLSRLWEALGADDVLGPLRGVVDLNLDYSHGADAAPVTGSGRIEVTNLRWDRTDLLGRFAGDIRIVNGVVRVPELSGRLAGGSVRLRASYNLENPARSWFRLALERVDGERVLAAFPGLGESAVEGSINAEVRGQIGGGDWRITGRLLLARGAVFGVEVADWTVPFTMSFSPRRGGGELEVRESVAQVGRGRAALRLSWHFGAVSQLDGQVRLTNADLRNLARSIPALRRQVGAGQVSARFDFDGRDVRTVKDVRGRLEASFNQGQALRLPVLFDVSRYLGGVTPSTTVRNGYLRASLGNGVWRVQNLSLESNTLRLFADGTVTLQGRLNLEVTARTGQVGVPPGVLRLLGLGTGTSVPLEVLTRASAWLSYRVVHLRVTGTLRSPTIRVQPLRLLGEQAVRFFLLQPNLPPALGGAGLPLLGGRPLR